MLSLAVGLVSFGRCVLGGNGGSDLCPCPDAGVGCCPHLPRSGVPFGRSGVFDHCEPAFSPSFCKNHSACPHSHGLFVLSGRACGRGNKKSFEKSKKGLSKMAGMV